MTSTQVRAADAEGDAPARAGPLLLLWGGPALTVLVLALLLGGGAPQVLAPGLAGADAGTRWLVPVALLATRLGEVGVVGSLVVGRLAPGAAARSRRPWALATSACAVAAALLTAADLGGRSPAGLAGPGVLVDVARHDAPVQALLATAALELAVAGLARRERTALALALLALLPGVLSGHAGTEAHPALAVPALALHVVAVVVWTGGLAGLVLHVRGPGLATALPRYSALALGCAAVAGLSGAGQAALRLPDLPAGYGGLLLAKVLALGALVACGAWHRARTVPAAVAGRPGAFLRLAVGEVAVMAVAVALGVALSRTPL